MLTVFMQKKHGKPCCGPAVRSTCRSSPCEPCGRSSWSRCETCWFWGRPWRRCWWGGRSPWSVPLPDVLPAVGPDVLVVPVMLLFEVELFEQRLLLLLHDGVFLTLIGLLPLAQKLNLYVWQLDSFWFKAWSGKWGLTQWYPELDRTNNASHFRFWVWVWPEGIFAFLSQPPSHLLNHFCNLPFSFEIRSN